MLRGLAVVLVGWCWRHAKAVTAGSVVVAALMAVYAAGHLALDTDESKLISRDLPFRKAERIIEQAFPQHSDGLVVMLDGPTSDLAEDAVERLMVALRDSQGRIVMVERPPEEMFFRRHGLLFLSSSELAAVTDKLISAQPMLAAVARDPSLRGLLASVDLMLQGVTHGQARIEDLEPLLTQLDRVAGPVAAGRKVTPIDWQDMMAAGPRRDAPRRFLLVQPRLDYSELEAGSDASRFIRDTAQRLNLTPEHGYNLRLTGSVALSDSNFATVTDGVELSAPLSLIMVVGLLFWGVRSGRAVAAIMGSLIFGLITTAAFAAVTVGSLNPISVAFAVLFVGMGVDFGIQFVTAFRAAHHQDGDLDKAARTAATAMASPLTLAAVATAVGFMSFLPTDYTGVSQLGLIAGGGMLIALATSFTLLPALLALMPPPPEREPVGLKLEAADAWLRRHARAIVVAACGLSVAGAALVPSMPLDFDPLHLQDPKAEAVAAFTELAKDPDSGVYGIEVLAASSAEVPALAARLEALPQVLRVMSVATFVPDQQEEKLAIVADVAGILGPSLAPAKVLPAPTGEELGTVLSSLAEQLAAAAPNHALSQRLAKSLTAIAADGPQATLRLQANAAAGLSTLVGGLRRTLGAEMVTLDTLPPELTRDWIAADGRARLRVLPKEDMGTQEARARFAQAVTAISPVASGAPIAMEESGKVVIRAFAVAGVGALVAIGLLLGIMLRRVMDSALVVAPLVMGSLCTVLAARLCGVALNFANVIALPLLLGIGVAFNIYFVVNWRAGVTDHLQSPTTRAVLFSALTTGSAFGSLAVSPHLGTASMGILLFLSLGVSVAATFVVLPAIFHLLGKPKT